MSHHTHALPLALNLYNDRLQSLDHIHVALPTRVPACHDPVMIRRTSCKHEDLTAVTWTTAQPRQSKCEQVPDGSLATSCSLLLSMAQQIRRYHL